MTLEYPGSLHNHTEYSNLRLRDSINRIEDLVSYAIELGQEVIAITEHETVANAIKVEKYYEKIKKDHPNFKIILGNEIYLCRNGLTNENFERGIDKYYHFILLAKDAIGHQQIRELSTRAWMRSWMSGKMRRVPTYYSDIEEIIGTNPGHVIGCSACLGSFIDNKILQWYNDNKNEELYKKIKLWCLKMSKLFGPDNFYLEMQPSANKEQLIVNETLYQLSKELNIPFIITTDSHYCKKEDALIHKAFLNSQDGEREVDAFYATTYLMGTEELESYMNNFSKEVFIEAYENIHKIKESCQDYSLKKSLKIPSLKWKSSKTKIIDPIWFERIPYFKTFEQSSFEGDKLLIRLIIDKINSDFRLQNQETYDETNDNLRITWISSEVNKAHWSAYFLNLQNIIDVCWRSGTIVMPGRGSGVGFLLLYLLDITQINPMWETTKTFSWRFLNPNRVSVLDVDTDIEGGRRAQVLQGLRDYYGEDKVANVVTFGSEKSKSAIQSAARGLEIDNDIALYISSLIPADRGIIRTLKQCYYGDEENDFKPIPSFVQEMNNYPDLWEVAQKIEGLVCRVGEHAGGIIFVDEPFVNSTALMKVPNGDIVTQFDLHDCEDVSLIKIDMLSIEAADKIHNCLDLLCEYGYIEKKPTLKETYESVIGIYNLERKDKKMWEMVWNHKIQSLFQMEKQSGVQGIALTHPESVDDLAVLNSVIRLMAQEKDAEQPLNKYARFKNNISLWYKEMDKYGLTKEEQKLLEPIVKQSYGICESQEKFMQLVQLPECGGFDLTFADKLRKSIAKKNPKGFLELQDEFFKNVQEKHLSKNLCYYVWNVLVSTSKGYGFNASHTLAYSLVGLQEMNLGYRFPIIFWNTACLITDSGGIGEIEGKNNNYNKIAIAISKMKQTGVEVYLPDINKSEYTFTPNVEENKIYFGFRGMLNVGDDFIKDIIANRPYSSPKDFLNRVHPKKQSMISLIKGGAFDNMENRKFVMAWYIWETCDKKARLTLQNMGSLMKYNFIPESCGLAKRVYEFNRYLKAICKADNEWYKLDERAINFIIELGQESLIENGMLNTKIWDKKVYQKYMDSIREWLAANKDEVLQSLNEKIFMDDWKKYASGTISAWEMEALCFYYHEHELKNINAIRYGFVDFSRQPEEPVVENIKHWGNKEIKYFKLVRICGTCIAKDKTKGIVTLLTSTGVVNVKMSKEFFAMFDRQISQKQPDGTKKIIEKSWFNRGSMIAVLGVRSGDDFIIKKYQNTPGARLYKIKEIMPNGDLVLTDKREQGDLEEEEDELY